MTVEKADISEYSRTDQRVIRQNEERAERIRLQRIGISPEEVAARAMHPHGFGKHILETPTKLVGTLGGSHDAPTRSAHADNDAPWLKQGEQ